jgi:UDPglucose 6-dehydrogenase
MLATRISFMNEIARLCEEVGADVEQVRRGMASDVRIGGHFLFPGAGFGGSCFPKDLLAIQHTAKGLGMDMQVLRSVTEVNAQQKHVLADKVKARFGGDLAGKRFALWGLAFKPGTDDMREAPSITIVNDLLEAGAEVVAHDPVARETAAAEFGDNLLIGDHEYDILKDADGLLLVTEWISYRSPDFERIRELLRTPVLFDGRNIWDRKFVERIGLEYFGIGR